MREGVNVKKNYFFSLQVGRLFSNIYVYNMRIVIAAWTRRGSSKLQKSYDFLHEKHDFHPSLRQVRFFYMPLARKAVGPDSARNRGWNNVRTRG